MSLQTPQAASGGLAALLLPGTRLDPPCTARRAPAAEQVGKAARRPAQRDAYLAFRGRSAGGRRRPGRAGRRDERNEAKGSGQGALFILKC